MTSFCRSDVIELERDPSSSTGTGQRRWEADSVTEAIASGMRIEGKVVLAGSLRLKGHVREH